ncbi:MAG: TolC family protein [Acidobacteriaceae bacterium]|nr:TolC family protein [Acidobacteriaceae bacterium]
MSNRTQMKFINFVLVISATVATGAAQQSDLPELTLDEAIQQAVANNSSLKTASLETVRANDDLASNRTRRFANTQVMAIGGQLLTKPSVTFREGSLGVYPGTGPIPGTDKTIDVPRKPAGLVSASIAQPLSQQYRIHLQLKALGLGVEATRQDKEKTRLEVIDEVRRAYYTVVQAQSALDSLEASLPFYKESERLAGENFRRETVLESDVLGADAQLMKTENAVSEAADQVANASEKLNDLMGRDVHVQFRVKAIANVDDELDTPAQLEAIALRNRPDLKKAKLQVQQADYDARAKKAEYIPDVSLAFTYFSTANLQNALPSNIAVAGFQMTWEPWDWGRKRQEYAEKRVKEEQAKVAVTQTERSVVLQVRTALRQLENTRRQLALTEATERASRQRLKEVQEQVKQEAVLTKVLFSAQSDLASADSREEQALAAFWQARADLKKAIGEQ